MTSRPYLFCSETNRTEYFTPVPGGFDLFQCNTLPIKGSRMKGKQKEQSLAAFVKTPHVFNGQLNKGEKNQEMKEPTLTRDAYIPSGLILGGAGGVYPPPVINSTSSSQAHISPPLIYTSRSLRIESGAVYRCCIQKLCLVPQAPTDHASSFL